MKTIKAKGLVFNGEAFITLCNENIPTRNLKMNHVALVRATIDFNDDRSITISGDRVDIRFTDKPIYFKSCEEAEQYRIDDMKKNWRGRIYIPAGWYMMEETEKYSATIMEPWFVDFSNYDFEDWE